MGGCLHCSAVRSHSSPGSRPSSAVALLILNAALFREAESKAIAPRSVSGPANLARELLVGSDPSSPCQLDFRASRRLAMS